MVYYPLWIASGGHKVLRRGPDFATPSAAGRVVREKIANGYASMGVVVIVGADGPEIMESYIYPASAQKVIRHYLDMMDYLDP